MSRHFLSRRSFIQSAFVGAVTSSVLGSCFREQSHTEPQAVDLSALSSQADHHNILFIFTDQERYFRQWPSGLTLPGHERLQRTGVTFHNHYTSAVMCTSSRSVLLTGLSTPVNGMFENTDARYVPNLSTDISTYGHLLRKAGYYTAYRGKWHLNRNFNSIHQPLNLTQEMEAYGFADYYDPGDIIGHTLGGYLNDHLIAGSAVRWLRNRGRPLNDENQPWCLTVSLVNPHDVMYFNTDALGENRQDNGKLAMDAARAPAHELYQASWDLPLPSNLYQSFDEPGRPQAHAEFHKMWGYVLGEVPLEDEPWTRLNNYYINCIRHVDQHLDAILKELDNLDLSRRTIIIFSSDHGEMAGAHGLRGKGPYAYEESTHLPFYLVHPDVTGGQNSNALSSHIDLVPTLLSMAGVEMEDQAELVGQALPGKDLTSILGQPEKAPVHAIRNGILFTYSGLMTNDSELLRFLSTVKDPDGGIRKAIKEGAYPNMKKRGSLRTVFDGRYKFTRYFSPREHNQPVTLDDLYASNDLELFDLKEDPQEMKNLAFNRSNNADLILSMSQKLQQLIQEEIGEDDGRELPNIPGIDWSLAKMDF